MNPEVPAVERLAGTARALESENDAAAVMRLLLREVLALVGGADCAGTTVVGKKGPSTSQWTDDMVIEVDACQYGARQGPCLEALEGDRAIRSDDLTEEARWPRFAPRASALGVRSMLSFPLFVAIPPFGSLNLYSGKPCAFDEDAERLGGTFAAHAAVALAAAHEREHLRRGLDHRDVIGQATGIVMERYSVGSGQAFAMLSKVSQDSNTKLHSVALTLASTGTLDALPTL